MQNRILIYILLTLLILVICCSEKEYIAPDFDYEIHGLEVQFKNLSKGALGQKWTFGEDTTVSKKINPIYKYKKGGTYDVTLQIIGNYNSYQTQKTIILKETILDFSYSVDTINSQTFGTVTFFDQSENLPDNAELTIDFGDGTNETFNYGTGFQSLKHQYNSGTYNVEVFYTIKNEKITSITREILVYSELIADFEVTRDSEIPTRVFINNKSKGSNSAQYKWDFGDGSEPIIHDRKKEFQYNYSFFGTYEITLTVKQGIEEKIQIEHVHTLIDFSHEYSNEDIREVLFSTNSIYGSNFTWDFGDRKTVTKQVEEIEHYYEDCGTYEVVLNIDVNKYSKVKTIEIPCMTMDIEITQINNSQKVELRATGDNIANASVLWKMGDGTQYMADIEEIVTHYYEGSGYFNISAKAIKGLEECHATSVVFVEPVLHSKLNAFFTFDNHIDDVSGNNHLVNVSGSPVFVFDRLGEPVMAIKLETSEHLKTDISIVDDWAISFWYRTDAVDGTFFSADDFSFSFVNSNFTIKSQIVNEQIPMKKTDNSWHHVVLSNNSETNRLSVYQDIQHLGTVGFENSGFSNLLIGKGKDENYFEGSFDDIRIYERSLNEADIEALFRE